MDCGEAVKKKVSDKMRLFVPDNIHPCAFLDKQFDQKQPWAFDLYKSVAVSMGYYLAIVQGMFHIPTIILVRPDMAA